MAVPNVTHLVTTTLFHQSDDIGDSVTGNIPLLIRLKSKDRIEKVAGGYELREPLAYQDTAGGLWFDGMEELSTTSSDHLSAAKYDWKMYAVPAIYSGKEVLMNSGSEEQLINTVSERVENLRRTMKNALSTSLHGDGTGSGGKELDGLKKNVADSPTTTSAGGINPATWSFWQNQLYDFSANGETASSATIQDAMLDIWVNSARNGDAIDLWELGNTYYKYFHQSLTPVNVMRNPNSDLAKAGFSTLEYKGGDVLLGGGFGGDEDDARGYGLNTDYIKLKVHKDLFMVPLSPRERTPYNQFGTVVYLGFMGNLCMSARFPHGVMIP